MKITHHIILKITFLMVSCHIHGMDQRQDIIQASYNYIPHNSSIGATHSNIIVLSPHCFGQIDKTSGKWLYVICHPKHKNMRYKIEEDLPIVEIPWISKYDRNPNSFCAMALSADSQRTALCYNSYSGPGNYHIIFFDNNIKKKLGTHITTIREPEVTMMFDPKNAERLFIHTPQFLQIHNLTSLTHQKIPCKIDAIMNSIYRTKVYNNETHYKMRPLMAISPDGKEMIYRTDKNTLAICDLSEKNTLLHFILFQDTNTLFDCLPTEIKNIIGNFYVRYSNFRIIHDENWKEGLGDFARAPALETAEYIKYSPDGHFIAVISKNYVDIFNKKTQKWNKLYYYHPRWLLEPEKYGGEVEIILSALFHPNGKIIIILSEKGIHFYDIEKGTLLSTKLMKKDPYSGNEYDMTDRLTFTPNDTEGKKLFVALQKLWLVTVDENIINYKSAQPLHENTAPHTMQSNEKKPIKINNLPQDSIFKKYSNSVSYFFQKNICLLKLIFLCVCIPIIYAIHEKR